MSDDTTQNFWSVLQHFQWPDPEPVAYRLYHDDQGRPLFYSMEDLPGTYIEVDQDTYVRSPFNVVVRAARLIELKPSVQVSRLCPSTDSGVCCDHRDVCVVVTSDRPHQKWKKVTNDIN